MKKIDQIPKTFEPSQEEAAIYSMWMEAGAFRAEAPSDKESFTIVMPPDRKSTRLNSSH